MKPMKPSACTMPTMLQVLMKTMVVIMALAVTITMALASATGIMVNHHIM
jgi:hypothetical protein